MIKKYNPILPPWNELDKSWTRSFTKEYEKHREYNKLKNAYSTANEIIHPFEVCMECQLPGDLLVCEKCDLGAHFSCTGLTVYPSEDEPWYCPNCKPLKITVKMPSMSPVATQQKETMSNGIKTRSNARKSQIGGSKQQESLGEEKVQVRPVRAKTIAKAQKRKIEEVENPSVPGAQKMIAKVGTNDVKVRQDASKFMDRDEGSGTPGNMKGGIITPVKTPMQPIFENIQTDTSNASPIAFTDPNQMSKIANEFLGKMMEEYNQVCKQVEILQKENAELKEMIKDKEVEFNEQSGMIEHMKGVWNLVSHERKTEKAEKEKWIAKCSELETHLNQVKESEQRLSTLVKLFQNLSEQATNESKKSK